MRDESGQQPWVEEFSADAVPAAIIAVDHSGSVAMVNSAARRLFGLSAADVGRPFEDLESIPGAPEMRSALELVQKEERPLVLEQVAPPAGPEGVVFLDIHLVPVVDAAGDHPVGVVLTFIDVSLARRLQDDLEAAYEELQSASAQLETTNEALQSTIEELQTTNQELHLTNGTLEAINDELRSRTGALGEVNDFLEALLISQPGGFVVVNRDLRILAWNDRSAELWGIRPDAARGQHFLNLDIGLPVEELRAPIMTVLAADSERETVVLDGTSRRGRELRCRVSMSPLLGRDRQIRGVIILTEETAA